MKRITTLIVFNRGDEEWIGRIVAALLRENVLFSLSYATAGIVAINVAQQDEKYVRQIMVETRRT